MYLDTRAVPQELNVPLGTFSWLGQKKKKKNNGPKNVLKNYAKNITCLVSCDFWEFHP